MGFFPFGVGALAGFRPGSRGVGFLSFAPRLLGFGWVPEGFGIFLVGFVFVLFPFAGGRLPGFGPAAEERASPAALSNPASALGGRHHLGVGGLFIPCAVACCFGGFDVALLG